MADLDRSKDFVTIFGGVPEDGAMFVQEGVRFKSDGTPVVVEKAPVVPDAKTATLADIASGKAAKKQKSPAKTAVAEPEEKLSAEVTHDFL